VIGRVEALISDSEGEDMEPAVAKTEVIEPSAIRKMPKRGSSLKK